MDWRKLSLKKIKLKLLTKLIIIKEAIVLSKFLVSNHGKYQFSIKDMKLYMIERGVVLPKANISSHDNYLNKITINNHIIYWPKLVSSLDLPWLYHEIFDLYKRNPSSYDNPNMNYSNSKWIIDAGSCEGYFSLFAFEKNEKCSVIALEPLEEMTQALGKTFENKTTQGKFNLVQKALGKEPGKALFSKSNESFCDSSIKEVNSFDQINLDDTYQVEVINLDNLMLEYNLESDGVIKMDIEGAEMDALEGGFELMKKHKPKLAIAVYHEYNNALKCKEIILKANPEYNVEFRGLYGYFKPPRPYFLFAW